MEENIQWAAIQQLSIIVTQTSKSTALLSQRQVRLWLFQPLLKDPSKTLPIQISLCYNKINKKELF